MDYAQNEKQIFKAEIIIIKKNNNRSSAFTNVLFYQNIMFWLSFESFCILGHVFYQRKVIPNFSSCVVITVKNEKLSDYRDTRDPRGFFR